MSDHPWVGEHAECSGIALMAVSNMPRIRKQYQDIYPIFG